MELFILLGKSAAILGLFYGVYFFFLRGDTFFTAKRHFFIAGILSAITIPFITFQKNIYIDPAPVEEAAFTLEELLEFQTTTTPFVSAPETSFDIWQFLFIIYSIGVIVLTFRFLFQALSLVQLLKKHTSRIVNGYKYVEVQDTISPFSVFKYIVYNPSLHSQEELQMILKHEETHATQWHSIDTLLSQLLCIFQWANPVSWSYKKAMIANLEFIADQCTVTQIRSKKQYQLTLVKASSPITAPALASPFYQSLIKKRIIMLNKHTSNKRNLIKMSIVLPLLAVFMLSFNVTENYVYTTDTHTVAQPQFIIQPQTSQEELMDMVAAINKDSNTFEVAFQQVERNATNYLTQLVIATKFTNQNRFIENITYGGEDKNISTIKLRVIDNELELRDVENKMELRITPKGVVAYSLPNEEKKQANNMGLGENPLYIINSKEYRKKDLPIDVVLENDGEIIVSDKKEGKAQYGAKGEDGVLHFKGNTTFNKKETQKEKSKVPIKTKGVATNDFEYKIHKDTTDEELKNIQEKLKEKGADFKYDVTRNKKNEITGISISYSDNKGNKTSYNIKNNKPITSIYFYRNEIGIGIGNPSDQEDIKKIIVINEVAKNDLRNAMEEQKEVRERVEIEERRERLSNERSAQMQQKREAMEERREALIAQAEALREQKEINRFEKKIIEKEVEKALENVRQLEGNTIIEIEDGIEPIYIINGEVVLKEELKNMSPNQIHSVNVNVLKGKAAVELYGTEGNNGVIQIITKSKAPSLLSDIYITKNTTDEDLIAIQKEMKQLGYNVSYKRKKRNNAGELTSIKVQVKGNGFDKVAFAKKDNGTPIDDMHISF